MPHQHAYHADPEYYEARAGGLLASAQDETAAALAGFARWDAPLSREGARTVIAREHGLDTWDELRRHVETLVERGEPFALAYRAMEAREVEGLRAWLDRVPDLVSARGTNGNDLLGMAGATCDERLVALLLERGADPSRANAHGWTPLHQAAYGNLPLLAGMLLDAGAATDLAARGTGGTPLIVALFWGNRETAELLAERGGVVPGNLRAAAGLGLLDMIDALLPAGAPPAAQAGAERGFYRPHSGFPPWTPGRAPQEVLDEALAWAARNDRADALTALVQRGANLEADVYRGTALCWAAACGRVDAIRRLLALGARRRRRDELRRPRPRRAGDTASPRRRRWAPGGHRGPARRGRRRRPARRDPRLDARRVGRARPQDGRARAAAGARRLSRTGAHDLLPPRGG